jgi:hypothetical protein
MGYKAIREPTVGMISDREAGTERRVEAVAAGVDFFASLL